MWVWQILEGSIWGLEIPPRDGSQALSWLGFCCPVPPRKENLRSLRFLGQAGNELGRNTKFSVKARQHSGGEIQCRWAGGGGRLASGPTLLSLPFMAQTAIHCCPNIPGLKQGARRQGFPLPWPPFTSHPFLNVLEAFRWSWDPSHP